MRYINDFWETLNIKSEPIKIVIEAFIIIFQQALCDC
jgi:hypothetical protein